MAGEFKEDVIAYPNMVALVGCVNAELEKSGLESVAFAGLMPGNQTIHEWCGEDCGGGQLTVRLITEFPTSSFPDQNGEAWTSQMTLAYTLEVEIMRCMPIPEDGQPLSMEHQLSAARAQLADMAAMRRAICACFQSREKAFALGQYTPVGPQGGCVGGNWTVTVSQ